ncbi:2856_t:CDS:2, partial [Acaulospora colombiana]
VRSESGEPLWTKTLVTDPSVINAYVRHRQLIEEQAMSAELLEPTNDEEKNKRLKKRIQDQLAKLRRNQERRQQRKTAREAAKAAATAENTPTPFLKDKKTETSRRCGNCGQTGHMKTNKKCPRYGLNSVMDVPSSPAAGPSTSSANTQDTSLIVKVGGNKISIITKPAVEKASSKNSRSSSESSKHKRHAPDVDSTGDRKRKRTFSLVNVIAEILKKLWETESAQPFHQPVTDQLAPDYKDIIKNPIDLSTIEKKNSAGAYNSIDDFMDDVKLMVENCKIYNGVASPYTSCAYEVLEKAKSLVQAT